MPQALIGSTAEDRERWTCVELLSAARESQFIATRCNSDLQAMLGGRLAPRVCDRLTRRPKRAPWGSAPLKLFAPSPCEMDSFLVRRLPMFEVGKSYSVKLWEDVPGDRAVTEYGPREVIEVAFPLVKFRDPHGPKAGEIIINTASLSFISAEKAAT